MKDSEHIGSSKRIMITDDGALRYYWNAWLPALFWGTVSAFSIWLGFFGLSIPGLDCFSLLLFFPGGIALLYFALGKALNYTEFRSEDGNLLVQHKPLPWRGNKSILLAKIGSIDIGLDIEDVEVKYGRRRILIGCVIFVTQPGKERRWKELCTGLSLENADLLTWELENMLGKPHHPDREGRIAQLKKRLTKYNSNPNW